MFQGWVILGCFSVRWKSWTVVGFVGDRNWEACVFIVFGYRREQQVVLFLGIFNQLLFWFSCSDIERQSQMLYFYRNMFFCVWYWGDVSGEGEVRFEIELEVILCIIILVIRCIKLYMAYFVFFKVQLKWQYFFIRNKLYNVMFMVINVFFFFIGGN